MAIADWGELHRNTTSRTQTKNRNTIHSSTRSTNTLHPTTLPHQVLATRPPEQESERDLLQRSRGRRNMQETENGEGEQAGKEGHGEHQEQRKGRRISTTGGATYPRNGGQFFTGNNKVPIEPLITEPGYKSQTHHARTLVIPTHSKQTHSTMPYPNPTHTTPTHHTQTQYNPIQPTPIPPTLSHSTPTHPTQMSATTKHLNPTQPILTQPTITQTSPRLAIQTHLLNTPLPIIINPNTPVGAPSAPRRFRDIVELGTPTIRGSEERHQPQTLQPRQANVIGHPAGAQLEVTHIESIRQDITQHPPHQHTLSHHILHQHTLTQHTPHQHSIHQHTLHQHTLYQHILPQHILPQGE